LADGLPPVLLSKPRHGPSHSKPLVIAGSAKSMRLSSVVVAFAAAVFSLHAAFAGVDAGLPEPDHVVLVIMENHAFSQIIGRHDAPFITSLAQDGATFVNSFAITHPSEPNYFALFSGSTQGVYDDGYHRFDGPTLASALSAAHKSFIGYVETGSPRKHNPWESFVDARGVERNLSDFPADFALLPTVSFVIPNLEHDMHDGSVRAGDRWLRAHLGAYAAWAKTHNSLLIVTFDEDDGRHGNRIPTIIYGDHVRPGRYAEPITHYTVLRTLLAMYGLPPLANSAMVAPIHGTWKLPQRADGGVDAGSPPKL
jgi:acid phosphatase